MQFTLLNSIDLKGTDIGKKSIKYITNYLKNKPPINTLNISDNHIFDPVITPLIDFTNEFPKIKKIKMNRCKIENIVMRNLSKIKVISISLKNCNIDSHSISLCNNSYIQELNLKSNQISSDGVLSICQNFPKMQRLNLSENNLNDISLIYISVFIKQKNCGLKYINLKGNKITTSGFMTLISVIIKYNRVLDKINFSNNAIEKFPKRLCTLNAFKVNKLSIGENNLTIDDLSILIDFININKDITHLSISKIFFDNMSLHFIFTKLIQNKHLLSIKLNQCYLGNTEINDILFSYYSTNDMNNKIKYLSIGYNFIHLKNFYKVINMNYLVYIDLQGNNLNYLGEELEEFFSEVLRSKMLIYLNLDGNFLKDKANLFLNRLSEKNCNCSLENLHLKRNQITNLKIELINLLSCNTKLKYLYLDYNDIKDELDNNYFFNSASLTTLSLLSLKDNKIGISFIDKAINFYSENANLECKVTINVKSKLIEEEYERSAEKSKYTSLMTIKKIIAL